MKKFLLAILLGLSLILPATTTAAPSGNIKIALVLLNWQDHPDQLFSTDFANHRMFLDSDSIAAYYEDTSYGKLHITGDVIGWQTVPYNRTPCLYGQWKDASYNMAVASGYDMTQYNYFVYAWSGDSNCGLAGYASIGQSVSYIGALQTNNLTESTIAHELGHNFGIDHANTRVCYDANHVQVQASSNCTDNEYQDPYDVMGNSSYVTMNAIHRTTLGWLPSSNTQIVTTNGTYSIVPLEWRTAQKQQIQIVIPKQGKKTFPNYYLEFRQSYGWDDFQETSLYGVPWAVEGVMIRQGSFSLAALDTFLMDATPNSIDEPSGKTRFDQPLPVGQVFYDAEARVKITTLSVGSTGATVKVEYLKK